MSLQRAHFILFVRDQARSARFYRAVLLADPVLDVPGMTELALPGDAVLGLMPSAGAARLLGLPATPEGSPSPPRSELYLVVDDPAGYLERAVAAGASVLSGLSPRDWGHDAGYVLDLDGHIVAFARTTSAATPRP
jgi:catechol 2,3-dioxygenase-like lactoylglutathione lyase family enzyme